MAAKHLRMINDAESRPTRHKLRVLIADDDRDTAVMMAAILRDEGDEVHTVLRGDEVLDVVRLFRPDAVMLDLNLPGMSGYAVAHEIRERHGTVAPLLIAISGVWKDAGERLAGRAMGFDHYLIKPCDPKQVLALLDGLRRGEASGQAAAK